MSREFKMSKPIEEKTLYLSTNQILRDAIRDNIPLEQYNKLTSEAEFPFLRFGIPQIQNACKCELSYIKFDGLLPAYYIVRENGQVIQDTTQFQIIFTHSGVDHPVTVILGEDYFPGNLDFTYIGQYIQNSVRINADTPAALQNDFRCAYDQVYQRLYMWVTVSSWTFTINMLSTPNYTGGSQNPADFSPAIGLGFDAETVITGQLAATNIPLVAPNDFSTILPSGAYYISSLYQTNMKWLPGTIFLSISINGGNYSQVYQNNSLANTFIIPVPNTAEKGFYFELAQFKQEFAFPPANISSISYRFTDINGRLIPWGAVGWNIALKFSSNVDAHIKRM